MNETVGAKELRSQVDSILNGRSTKALALRSRANWGGGELVCRDQTFEVCQVRSVLEFHERLLDAEDRNVSLVCLTELDPSQLGLDLLSRLFRRRLHSVDPWTAVRSRFQAQEVEASLVPLTHLAKTLIDVEPASGYAKVKGRVLTVDKVWSCLFAYALGMPPDYLDPLSLLQWSSGDTRRYVHASQELKQSARERIAKVCGSVGRLVMACLDDGRVSPLAVGLALRCVFGAEGVLEPDQEKAAIRLETYLADQPVSVELGREWARAAEHVAEADRSAVVLNEAEEFLEKLQLGAYAHLSEYLEAGLQQRLQRLGAALKAALDSTRKGGELEQRTRYCVLHRGLSSERRERLEMLPRLVRWLQGASPTATDKLGELARQHAHDTAFADLARLRSEGGLSDPALGESLAVLENRVVERMERESEAFARALEVWSETGTHKIGAGVMGVEDVLDKVVLELLKEPGARVLMVVLDGCSWATMHELLRSVSAQWTLRQPSTGALPFVLAAFPSVTEFSRTSLLAGRLVAGNSSTESQAFREHGGLRAACGDGYPPAVYHKGDLEGEFGGLSDAVVSKISQPKNKIVAVVLNAIDDHLDRDDQILGRWSVDKIKYLETLLALAAASDRTVILASDHGHVLERGSELRKGASGGARWQTGRSADEGEVQLTGSRVLCPGGSVVMPWTERVRYTMKKNGYHGGAHPREVLAPLVVLAPLKRPQMAGWVEVRHELPKWWEPGGLTKASPKLNYQPKEAPAASGQLALFSEPVESQLPHKILEFPLVAQQWKAQKNAPSQAEAAKLIKLLEGSGRQATIPDLSLAMGVPEGRFRLLLGQLGPLLTVDGVPIIGLTVDGGSVFLNARLVEELPFVPPAKKKAGQVVEVQRGNGDLVSFEVPLTTVDTVERLVLEGLARHGRLTESQLKKLTGSRRVAGAVEKLMERLQKAGFAYLSQDGEGPEGRIYSLSAEALG